MIDRQLVSEHINDFCAGSPLFLVDLKVTGDNRIFVFLDGDDGVTIDDCRLLSRFIEEQIDREVEDYDLTVSSFGLEHPLKLLRQYRKNVGKNVELTTSDGERRLGRLHAVENDTIYFLPQQSKKKTKPMSEAETEAEAIPFRDIQEARIQIQF